ncbi:hypothetical protein AAMO2058_000998400 [Amorphochlora amoebiformis]
MVSAYGLILVVIDMSVMVIGLWQAGIRVSRHGWQGLFETHNWGTKFKFWIVLLVSFGSLSIALYNLWRMDVALIPFELAAVFCVLLYVELAFVEHLIVIMFVTGYGTLFSLHPEKEHHSVVYRHIAKIAWVSFIISGIIPIVFNKAVLFSLTMGTFTIVMATDAIYGLYTLRLMYLKIAQPRSTRKADSSARCDTNRKPNTIEVKSDGFKSVNNVENANYKSIPVSPSKPVKPSLRAEKDRDIALSQNSSFNSPKPDYGLSIQISAKMPSVASHGRPSLIVVPGLSQASVPSPRSENISTAATSDVKDKSSGRLEKVLAKNRRTYANKVKRTIFYAVVVVALGAVALFMSIISFAVLSPSISLETALRGRVDQPSTLRSVVIGLANMFCLYIAWAKSSWSES